MGEERSKGKLWPTMRQESESALLSPTQYQKPEEEKLRTKIPGAYYGYNPLGAERVAYSRGEQTPPDPKANFFLGFNIQ